MRRPALVLALLVACGGEDLPPLKPPPPPTAEPTAALLAVPDAGTHTAHVAPPKTKTELRTATLRAMVTAASAHDATKLGASYASDAVMTVYGQGGDVSGQGAIVAAHAAYFASFGEMKMGMRRVWQSDDAWAVEWAFGATHVGAFMGLAPKGASVGAVALSVVWFDDAGLVTKEHRYFDSLTLRDQIKGASAARLPPSISEPPPETHVPGLGVTYPEDLAATAKLFTVLDTRDAEPHAALRAMLVDDPGLDSYALDVGTAKGRAAFDDYDALVARAVPDGKHSAVQILAADHYVVSEYDLTGTLKGSFPGVPATRTRKELHGATVVQWRDGKVLAMWTYANRRELLPSN